MPDRSNARLAGMAALAMLIAAVGIFAFAPQLMRIFTGDSAVVELFSS